MSWPVLPAFGIVNSPLLESPFVSNNDNGTMGPPVSANRFLLLSGGNFNLLNGAPMLLLE
jgi:hypothetical protein